MGIRTFLQGVAPGTGANALAAAASILTSSRVAGDTADRFNVGADGKLQWGPGNGAVDTALSRLGAGALIADAAAALNGQAALFIRNTTVGTAALAQLFALADTAAGGFQATSSAFTPAGLLLANLGRLTSTGAGGLLVDVGAADIVFATGGTAAANERLRLDNTNGRATLTGWPLLLNNGTAAGGSNVGGRISFGTGAPNNANGSNGDIYLRVDGGALTTVYQRRLGAWVGIV